MRNNNDVMMIDDAGWHSEQQQNACQSEWRFMIFSGFILLKLMQKEID